MIDLAAPLPLPRQALQTMDMDIGRVRLDPKTIDYTITPRRFILDIPVEALAGLSPDAHTRMLAMLNAWITEHKPVVVKGPTP
jgi:hypothetical protein